MKVVILAGGLGSRLSEETHLKPKPMVEIGGKPILWHIMKIYSSFGYNEFVICLGFKGYVIKEYFANYYLHSSDITFSMKDNKMEIHQNKSEPWKVTLVDTGQDVLTGGRVARIKDYVNDEPFFLTYGDGVGDINIEELLAYHQSSKKYVTLTATQPSGKYGVLSLSDNNLVEKFSEKPELENSWINSGFFVMEPQIFDYILEGDKTILERSPLENLSLDGQLNAYRHKGFWKSMDTLRDKNELNKLWEMKNPPWKIWFDKSSEHI